MASLNFFQLLSQIKNGNPRMVAEQIIQTNYANNPMMQNLLRMGQNGDVQGLEQFATQYFGQQGSYPEDVSVLNIKKFFR